jgi:hypothetical protein
MTDRAQSFSSTWRAQHDHDLLVRACTNVQDVIEAVSDEGVSRNQLQALKNTASACGSVKELLGFVQKRAKRREKAGKETKARFWRAVETNVKAIQQEYENGPLLLITRRYLTHFANECLFQKA